MNKEKLFIEKETQFVSRILNLAMWFNQYPEVVSVLKSLIADDGRVCINVQPENVRAEYIKLKNESEVRYGQIQYKVGSSNAYANALRVMTELDKDGSLYDYSFIFSSRIRELDKQIGEMSNTEMAKFYENNLQMDNQLLIDTADKEFLVRYERMMMKKELSELSAYENPSISKIFRIYQLQDALNRKENE